MDLHIQRNEFEEQFWLDNFSVVIKKSNGKILNKSSEKQLTALAKYLVSKGYQAWVDRHRVYVELSDEDYVFGLLSHE